MKRHRATRGVNARSADIASLVDDIRKRWKRRTIVRGGLFSIMVFLLLSFLLLLAIAIINIGGGQALAGAGIVVVMTGLVLYRYVYRPLKHQPTDEQLALFVEEKLPGLEDAFNSAVEVDSGGEPLAANLLVRKLMEDALSRSRIVSPATVVDRRREQWMMYAAGALFVTFLLFGYTVKDRIDFSGGKIELASLRPEPAISIIPGSAEVEKGASQEIIIRFRDVDDAEVFLVSREGDGEWQRDVMERGSSTEAVYLFELQNIQEPVEYFIEYGAERTELFTLSLYEFPAVEEITLTYRYPSYTGLASVTEEGTGDIRALYGTTVQVSVATTGSVKNAELVLGAGSAISMSSGISNIFEGNLTIRDDDWYHVRLTDDDGKENRFPAEYRIEVVEDLEPIVRFTEPNRDLRANSIEEILVSLEATDDIGLRDLDLRFSVNASEEESITIASEIGRNRKEVAGEHMFFLEDYTLVPGDVISYYAEVRDHLDRSSPVATDMYFIEVVPFDKDYQQANNNGGGMPGRSGGVVLSQQQIITATWKLHREWNNLEDAEAESSLRALIQAQANLKFNIEQRISSTAFSLELRNSAEQMQVVEYLRTAIEEMDAALAVLEQGDLKEAITPERRALNSLLRADAMNKEQQVAVNRGGQPGPGGSVQDRISELMDLELDISKDKYETQQQQSPSGSSEQAVDDALKKVQELARKQEELEQRSRENGVEGEDQKRFVEQLKRDQDDLKQQTEQLTQSLQQMQNDASSRRREESAQRIADNMAKAERALREGDIDEAMKYQRRALNELEDLQQGLEAESAQGARGSVQNLANKFDEFREQERRLSDDIDTALEAARTGRLNDVQGTLDDLQTKRQRMIENLDELVDRAGRVAEDVRDDEPELSTALRNILQQIRRDGLKDNMTDSREALRQGWLDYADRKEEPIMRTIEDIETQRRALDFSMAPSGEEQASRSLSDARDLRDQLEEIQRMSDERRQAQQSGENGAPGDQEGDGSPGQGDQQSDRAARAAEARLQNQIERAQQTLNRLQEGMNGNPGARRQLDRLQAFLNDARGTGTRLEGDAAKEYFNDRAYAPLSQIEDVIVQELDEIAMERKLHGARRSDVPAKYQELVDKYYESLSKENN